MRRLQKLTERIERLRPGRLIVKAVDLDGMVHECTVDEMILNAWGFSGVIRGNSLTDLDKILQRNRAAAEYSQRVETPEDDEEQYIEFLKWYAHEKRKEL